jgi:tetratricopeptide (TPR) repeat protein
VLLIVAGTFAGMGLLAMLLMAVFQWRTVNRLAEISAALPPGPGMGGARPIGLLGAGEAPLAAHAPEQTNQRLLGALDRLEKRIYELEHTAQPPLPPAPGEPVADEPELHATPANGAAEPAGNGQAAVVEGSSDVARLLGQGQALLDANKAEEALACFDQVLRLDANHTDALVKKGAALEKLQKLDEAIECYDRAIAADGSMTIAYLYKGGVFNRLERFSEALKCYEQALRTQEGRRG